LTIIVFTPEFDNGALGGVNRHYKCRHIIATLHANVIVDDLGTGIPRFRAYGTVMLVVVGYN